MTRSSRGTVSTHYGDERFRRCPICQNLIDLDHDEAVSMDFGILPNEFDAEAIAAEVEAEKVMAELRGDCDFFVAAAERKVHRGGSPTDTNPCIEVGFSLR